MLGSEASEGMGQRLLEDAVSWGDTLKGWDNRKSSRACGASSHSDPDVAKWGSDKRDLCGAQLSLARAWLRPNPKLQGSRCLPGIQIKT